MQNQETQLPHIPVPPPKMPASSKSQYGGVDEYRSYDNKVVFFTIYLVKSAEITLRESITVYSHAMDALASLNDRLEGIGNTSARQNPRGVAWWIRHIGINVEPAGWQSAFKPA